MWVTAKWPPSWRVSNLRVRPQTMDGDSRGGGSKCSHDLCHHHKQAMAQAPSISHPSTPRRANAFPWDNPTKRLGFALIWKWTCCHFRSWIIASAVFACFPAASQGGMCKSPVFTSETNGKGQSSTNLNLIFQNELLKSYLSDKSSIEIRQRKK